MLADDETMRLATEAGLHIATVPYYQPALKAFTESAIRLYASGDQKKYNPLPTEERVMNEVMKDMMNAFGLDDFMVFGRIESKEDAVENLVYMAVSECCRVITANAPYAKANELNRKIKEHFGFDV